MRVWILILIFALYCQNPRKQVQTDYSQEILNTTEKEKSPSFKKQNSHQQRILTYKGYITIKIENEKSQEVKTKIIDYVKTKEGYVVTESTHSLTLRVPADKFRDVITEVKKMGEVISESFSLEDITDAYYDAQIRLENAQKLQERLLELLKKAKTVQETIEVEKELNRVTNEIDTLKSKLFRLDNQVQFSTLNVNLQEKSKERKLGPLGWVFYGIYKVIKFLFVIEEQNDSD